MNIKEIVIRTVTAIVVVAACLCPASCEKNTDPNAPTFDTSKLNGTWEVNRAKFAEDAIMTDWDQDAVYMTFREDGGFVMKGYFGNEEGTFSVTRDEIAVTVNSMPYMYLFVETATKESITAKIKFSRNSVVVWAELVPSEGPADEPGDGPEVKPEYPTEDEADRMKLDLYSGFAAYMIDRQALEDAKLAGSTDTASLTEAMETKAYSTVSAANAAIKELSAIQGAGYDPYLYVKHATCIRDFTLYSMAALTGEARLQISSPDDDTLTASSFADVVTFVYNDMTSTSFELLGYFWDSDTEFSDYSTDSFITELCLAAGDMTAAAERADNLNNYSSSKTLTLEYMDQETRKTTSIVVYNSYTSKLLVSEAEGRDVSELWEYHDGYGRWNARQRAEARK